MDIKDPLTKQELLIYNSLKDIKTVFTNKEIQDIFQEYKAQRINEILFSLNKKNYLINLEKSKYILNEAYSIEDLFKLSYLVNYNGYIAFSSALYYYGLIDYEPFTIFVINSKKSKELTINNYVFKYINLKKELINNFKYKNGFYISTLEKTIFDCFYKLQYSGGYSVISKAIYESYKKIDWNKLIEIYKKLASSRQHQITGYILSILIEKTNIKIQKKIINYFLNKDKSRTYLSNNYSKNNFKYITTWKLKDNIGINKILSWWY